MSKILTDTYNIHRGDTITKTCKITFSWDDEACVWIAVSDDTVCLALEHESLDILLERVRIAVPELLSMENNFLGAVDIEYTISRQERLVANG